MINTEHYGSIDDHNKIDKGDTIKVECRGKVSRESGGVFPVQINDGVSSGLFGFRKFARSYIFGPEKYDRQCEASASTYPKNIQLGTNPKETSGSHGNAIPKGVSDAGKEEIVQETEGVKVLELGNACHFPTSESGKANSEENANSSVSTETSSSGSSTSTKARLHRDFAQWCKKYRGDRECTRRHGTADCTFAGNGRTAKKDYSTKE